MPLVVKEQINNVIYMVDTAETNESHKCKNKRGVGRAETLFQIAERKRHRQRKNDN